jgi:hypothetical protein
LIKQGIIAVKRKNFFSLTAKMGAPGGGRAQHPKGKEAAKGRTCLER